MNPAIVKTTTMTLYQKKNTVERCKQRNLQSRGIMERDLANSKRRRQARPERGGLIPICPGPFRSLPTSSSCAATGDSRERVFLRARRGRIVESTRIGTAHRRQRLEGPVWRVVLAASEAVHTLQGDDSCHREGERAPGVL
jgi:hypothetical protein